jgi:hypothetical protein
MTVETVFGRITINGEEHNNDVIIHVDGRITKRHKKLSKELKGKYGHTPLSARELDFLSEEDPEVVIIGTGQYGDLPITPGAKEVLADYETIIRTTPEVVELIKKETRRLVAVIHVTC